MREIDPTKYDEVYTIVVTQERFGAIQTNLEILLEIEDDDDYPWSVCVDDLEVFLLALKKKKMGTMFLRQFLNHRRHYHGHIVCGDELETCALFIQDAKTFVKDSTDKSIIFFDPRSTQIFEELYQNGLGFKNERHYDMKLKKQVGFPFGKKPSS